MKRTALFWIGLLAVAAAPRAGAAEKLLVVDPAQSRIEVEVKATMGSFVGHLAAYDAAVRVDEASARVKAAELTFHFSDVKTGEEKRDRHMHEWQETAAHPDCRFELTQLTAGSDGSYLAAGRFTLHGLTRPLRFPVQITTEGTTMAIDGEAVVNTPDFGLPVIRKFIALKVNPLVTVRFHLQGKLPAGV